MKAKWQSRCPLCDKVILRGELIQQIGERRWGHLDCVMDERAAARRSAQRAHRVRHGRRRNRKS